MNLHQIRYMFEHRLLPGWFFENKAVLVGLILEDKSVLYRMIDDIFKAEEVENPYTVQQFDVDTSRITDEVMMLKIIFPKPEEEPLCYCSYLFFNRQFDKLSFFCIERGNSVKGEELPFVCGWTADGNHMNYGQCTFEKQNDLQRCVDIYMEQ